MEIKKCAVLGAGQMGGGIIQVFVMNGYDTTVWVRSDASEERAVKKMDKFFAKQVEKGRMSDEEKEACLARIHYVRNLEDIGDEDLVVEAVTEDMELKAEIFRTLDANCKPEAILATNTSSLPITKIAAVTGRADKVVGMHFMNPVPVMKLVEVSRRVTKCIIRSTKCRRR